MPKLTDRRALQAGFLLLLLVFAVSVFYRYPVLIDDTLNRVHQYLLAHSTLIASNWQRAGFFNLHGLATWNVYSIETSTPELMKVYSSFPAGAFVLPYFVSWLLQLEVTPRTFQVYALLNQLLIALTVFGLARQLTSTIANRVIERLVLCLLPAFAILFAPGYMWHFGSTWFGEQAGVLPFVAVVYFDVLGLKGNKHARWWAFAVVLFGTYCDPAFFLEVSFVRFLLKFFERKKSTSFKDSFFSSGVEAFAPFAIAVFLHLSQLVTLYGAQRLWDFVVHALDHIKPPADRPITLKMLWMAYTTDYLHMAYGRLRYFLPLIIAGLVAIFFLRPALRERRFVFLSLLAAPFLHLLVWKTHARHHSFNTVRFDAFVALMTFMMVPLVLSESLKKVTRLRLIVALSAILLVLAARHWKGVYRDVFVASRVVDYPEDSVPRAKLINKTFGFEHLLFSSDFWIDDFHELTLVAHSKKAVYQIKALENTQDPIKQNPKAIPVLLFTQKNRDHGCSNVKVLSDSLYYCFLK